MKKIMLLITILFSTMIFTVNVEAASFVAKTSTKNVKPGGTFTISVGGDAIGRVNLKVSNGTLSTSSVWVEQNTQTIKVKAGNSGMVVVTATPVTGFSDADANPYNPGSKSVKVNITSEKDSSGTKTESKPKTTIQTKKKSSNNALASLQVDGIALTPKFSSALEKYTLNIPKDITSIKITAKAEDKEASVSGAGTIKVVPGLNTIYITVTAENGSKKRYTIEAFVDDAPSVFLTYKNTKVGVVKILEGISIEGFEKEEKEIENEKITLFKRENLSILYGSDENNNKAFYLFDEKTNAIKNKIIPVNILGNDYYIVDKEDDLEQRTIRINDKEIMAYKISDYAYSLVHVVDLEGDYHKYVYDEVEGTLQRYSNALFKTCEKEENHLLFIISLSFNLFFLGIWIYFYRKMKKGK